MCLMNREKCRKLKGMVSIYNVGYKTSFILQHYSCLKYVQFVLNDSGSLGM